MASQHNTAQHNSTNHKTKGQRRWLCANLACQRFAYGFWARHTQASKQAGKHASMQASKQASRQAGKQASRQAGKEASRQTATQTNRQHTYTCTRARTCVKQTKTHANHLPGRRLATPLVHNCLQHQEDVSGFLATTLRLNTAEHSATTRKSLVLSI